MFFALLLNTLAAKCNESSLDPGFICCEDNPCQGHCIKLNDSDVNSESKCITEAQYQICYAGYIYPVFMAICCIPTIIFWILSCFSKTNVPSCTWITNIFLNICFCAVIQSIPCIVLIPGTPAPMAFLIVGLALFMSIYPIARVSPCSGGPECCSVDNFSDAYKENYMADYASSRVVVDSCSCCCECCVPKPYDPFNPKQELCCGVDEDKAENTCDCIRYIREARSSRVTKEELQVIIDENAIIPPTPKSAGIAFFRTKEGYHVVQKEFEPIQYGSWQENRVRENISKDKIIYKCNARYIYNENMRQEIERANAAALEKVKGVSTYETSYDQFEFNGMTKRAIYGNNCVFDVFSTCCYRFFYEFLFMCGYNGISDYFWNRNAQRIVFKSTKEISMDDSLRAKSGERDQANSNDNIDDSAKEEEIHQSLV
ncbi:hypothetical protein TVAG_290610 [Trichomonas vaginalis G3]|uniref:Uncharacterized protein n=1 Tax=Trichomonas vaginalis (strain ATCC PRA-98 / G3) TaxID=412133 RepID=A2EQU5_TRIV3|nr:hypothetical protein TVAGG3_0243700 [Trichomonas vaginalis G3]EAY04991.1 hypothetical protein TVAG_290610 [Trichomonas vaginalis G3]KAI5553517.1 hypothetical protein TVAGG3_0243700 [Trichomonas vaginalis G3]|eukprot:XP_001317214.1 hypothetical protein [Trichomonas vaginalis G3]